MSDLAFKPEYGTIRPAPSTTFVDPHDHVPTMCYIATSRHGGAAIFWARSSAEFWLTVRDAIIRSREMRSRVTS